MEFTICLDALGKAGPLYLHVSRPPKTAAIRQLYQQFRDTAAQMSIPFEIVHRKINVSDPTVYWQHEQYSRRRLVAGTLSSRAEPAPGWTGSSVLDNEYADIFTLAANTCCLGSSVIHCAVPLRCRSQIDLVALARNIKFLGEVLGKQIYRTSPSAYVPAAD